MRANEPWLQLDQFAILAYLDRILTIELHIASPPAQMRSPQPLMSIAVPHPRMPISPASPLQQFGPMSRGRAYPPWLPLAVGPGRLLHRFFEAIASGLLLQLGPETQPSDPKTEANVDKPQRFFAFTLLAKTPLAIREEITLSAQFHLRQIVFRQFYKVLRMEQLTSSYTYRKGNTKEPLSSEASAGAVKRRRIDDESNAEDAVTESAPKEEGSKTVDQTDVVTDIPKTEQAKVDEPVAPISAEPVEHVTEVVVPAAPVRSAPKRGRRGR